MEKNIIKEENLAVIFGEDGLRFIAEDIKAGKRDVKTLTILHLFNESLIKEKGVDFLIEVYKHADKLEKLPSEGAYVLDNSGQVVLLRIATLTHFQRMLENS